MIVQFIAIEIVYATELYIEKQFKNAYIYASIL